MKNILFLTTILLNSIAFGQNKPTSSFPEISSFLSAPSKIYRFEPQQDPGLFLSPAEMDLDIDLNAGELLDLIQQYDSVYFWQWDDFVQGWQVQSKYVYTSYNAHHFPISFTNLTWNGIVWENIYQYHYTYDQYNNTTSFIIQLWTGSSWENYYQSLLTYFKNDLVTLVSQQWNGLDWENSYRTISVYNENHNIINSTLDSWNIGWFPIDRHTYTYDTSYNKTSSKYELVQGIEWVNNELNLYTYDSTNNLITNTKQLWNGTSWDNSEISTYTYDSNSNVTGNLRQTWNGTDWVNYGKRTNIYNASNNLTYELNQFWNGTGWENSYRYTLTYNGNLMIKALNEEWDEIKWLKSRIYLYSYDENNFYLGTSLRDFNTTGEMIIDGDSTHYYFQTVTGMEDLIDDISNIIVYPNPSNGKFTISSPSSLGTIEVYDQAGKRVFTSSAANDQTSREIDLTRYGMGVYIVNLKDGQKTISKKVVVR